MARSVNLSSSLERLALIGATDGVGPVIVFGLRAGAGIGALVDSFINHPATLFESKKTSARPVPTLSGSRRGVLVSLTY